MNNINQHISLTRSTINQGKGEGSKIITIENGVLSLVLDESHGLDIYSLRYKGKLVSLLTSNGMVKEAPFAKQFPGGMLYTCGLDAIGFVEGHRQHGEYHTYPAEIVSVEHNENELVIKGLIKVTGLFLPQINVTRTFKIQYNKPSFTLEDNIENQTSKDEEIVMLYHFNMGYPFVNGNVKIDVGSTQIKGTTPFAQERIVNHKEIKNELEDEEEVFYHYDANDVLKVHSDGLVWSLQYDKNNFPIVTEWKSLVDGNIALGIEPTMSEMGANLKYKVLKGHEMITNRFIIKIEEE